MIQYSIEGKVQTAEPDWTNVPADYKDKCSAICRSMKDCDDLVHWFDSRADFCPDLPVLLLIPGVHPPVAVCGMGYATAAELRDTCCAVWQDKTSKLAHKGALHDFDDLRERQGQMPREKVAEMAQYAFWDRVARHKASPRTDPFKQFRYPNPFHKKQFLIDGRRGTP